MIFASIVAGAALLGSLAGSGDVVALADTPTVSASAAAGYSVGVEKLYSEKCGHKSKRKHACSGSHVPSLGGGYVWGVPGQSLYPSGSGYVSAPPGQEVSPTGGGYVSTPPGVAIPPDGGGYVSTPPGVAIPPSVG